MPIQAWEGVVRGLVQALHAFPIHVCGAGEEVDVELVRELIRRIVPQKGVQVWARRTALVVWRGLRRIRCFGRHAAMQ